MKETQFIFNSTLVSKFKRKPLFLPLLENKDSAEKGWGAGVPDDEADETAGGGSGAANSGAGNGAVLPGILLLLLVGGNDEEDGGGVGRVKLLLLLPLGGPAAGDNCVLWFEFDHDGVGVVFGNVRLDVTAANEVIDDEDDDEEADKDAGGIDNDRDGGGIDTVGPAVL